ncbi:polyprotein, partial [Cardamom mosaic virus]
GNNIGQPSTVVDNTLILMMSFYYAYIMKTQDFDCEHIHKRMKFVCNGDDNKFSLAPSFVKEFGGEFTTEIKQLGLTYEFDDLTDDITENPYMSLTMVRTSSGIGFSLHPSRVIAIVQWIKKGDIIQATQAAFAAMIEAYNDPWLFSILASLPGMVAHEYKDALNFARVNGIFGVVYFDPCQVHALHYGTPTVNEFEECESESCIDDDDFEAIEYCSQQFQMDLVGTPTAPRQGNTTVPSTSSGTTGVTPPGGSGTRAAPLAPMTGQTSVVSPPRPVEEPDTQLQESTLGGGDDDADIQWRIPPTPRRLSHFNNPRVKGKRIWNRKIINSIAKEQFTQSSQLATTLQFEKWAEDVRKSLGTPNEEDFQIYLTSWCLWCANNGTSSEVDVNQNMEIHSGGKYSTIPIAIFVEPAVQNGGLRKIMRHLSDITSQILAKGGKMTAWGTKRGYTQLAMIPYAFDFCVQTNGMPKTVREQLNQGKAAAIGSGYQRVMLLDGKVQRSKTSYERHVDTDIDEFEHGSTSEPRATLY